MRRLALPLIPLLAAALLAAPLLGGCGDPAPSTALAPDKALPDTSKMSDAEIERLHSAGSAGGSDRSGTPGAAPAPADHGGTPADRGG